MIPMWLIQIIVVMVVAGIALWVLAQFPLDPTIARILKVVIIAAVCIWLLFVLVGLLSGGAAPLIARPH